MLENRCVTPRAATLGALKCCWRTLKARSLTPRCPFRFGIFDRDLNQSGRKINPTSDFEGAPSFLFENGESPWLVVRKIKPETSPPRPAPRRQCEPQRDGCRGTERPPPCRSASPSSLFFFVCSRFFGPICFRHLKPWLLGEDTLIHIYDMTINFPEWFFYHHKRMVLGDETYIIRLRLEVFTAVSGQKLV